MEGITTEIKKNRNVIEVPLVEGFCEKVGRTRGPKGKELDLKATSDMGKAVFAEFSVGEYNFVQWKGPGKTRVSGKVQSRIAEHIKSTLGQELTEEGSLADKYQIPEDKSVINLTGNARYPLALTHSMGFEVRFLGGAFYGDLVDEETTSRKVNEITGGRLRQPWITRTWVLDEDFCRENSLPGEGETFSEYFCKHRGEVIGLLKEQGVGKPEELFEDMVKEIGDERAQLGMNKRLFRNVFRVSEVEMLSRTEAQNAREAGRSLIETSKAILEKELEKKLDYEGFVFEYSKLLGEQAAILVNNKIIHNDLKLHKQNVTLAAEICDFDCAYVAGDLDGYPEENAKPEGFETEDAWRRYQEKLIFEQILILGGAYIRPIARLFNSIEVEISRKVIEEGFLGGFLGEIPEGRKNELSDFMSKNEFGLAFIENLVEPSPSLGNLMEENLSESAVDFLRIAEKLRLALN